MKEFDIPFKEYKTHVYQYGKLKDDSRVIILLHGGPGGTSKGSITLADLSKRGYVVIAYDQLGGGKSSSIANKIELFKIDTFVSELHNLIKFLNLKKYDIIGHSWGGMLALEYIKKYHPKELNKLVLFSSLSSSKVWNESNYRRCLTILDGTPIKETFIKAYKTKNNKVLNQIFKKNIKPKYTGDMYTSPYPKKKRYRINKETYNYMWGVVDLFATGPLLAWDITSSLKDVNYPTLIIYGKYDQSTDEVNQLMHKNIKGSSLVYLSHSGHCGYNNEYQKSLDSIDSFLKNN